jgi:hypothetical protein
MKPNEYPINTTITASALFTDAQGAAYDPVALRFLYGRAVGGLIANPTILIYGTDAGLVKDGTGRYHATFTPDAAGDWGYRYEDTNLKTAAEVRVLVQESLFYA